MAILFVNGATNADAGVTATSIPVTYSPTNGNFVAAVLVCSSSSTVTAFSDNGSSSYAVLLNATGATCRVYAAYTPACSGSPTTFTWTISPASLYAAAVGEYSGVKLTGTRSGSVGGTSTTPTRALTIEEGGNFSLMTGGIISIGTITANTGNLRKQQVGTAYGVFIVDNTAGSRSAVTCSVTDSVSGTWLLNASDLRVVGAIPGAMSPFGSDQPLAESWKGLLI